MQLSFLASSAHTHPPCCCERFTRVKVAKGDLLFGAGRAEDVAGVDERTVAVGLVVARQVGGWVEERSAGERSVLPRRAPMVTVAVQVRTLTNHTALAARLSGLETSDVALPGPSTISPHNLA